MFYFSRELELKMNYMKIAKIEKIENQSNLYDLETKKNHNFFANNVLVHNSSCTIYHNNGEVGVCSRNFELKMDQEGNAYVDTAKEKGYVDGLISFGKNIAIQAELCGPRIQGNIYELPQLELFVFDVWLIDERRYATQSSRLEILSELESLGVKVNQVPHLGVIRLPETMKDLLALADGKSKINPAIFREGLVFKSKTAPSGQVLSFKAISNQFLLGES